MCRIVGRPSRVGSRVTLALSVLLGACGDTTGPDGNGGGNTMTASIDGSSFEAVLVEVRPGAPDTISVVGTTSTAASPVTQLSLFIADVGGTGTYTVDATNFPAGLALVTVTDAGAVSQWSTTQAAGPGSVTITSLTANSATGTFQFTAEPDPGTAATGQVSVTSGTFSITF